MNSKSSTSLNNDSALDEVSLLQWTVSLFSSIASEKYNGRKSSSRISVTSIISTNLVLQASLSLCLKDSGQNSSILISIQFLRGTDKLKK